MAFQFEGLRVWQEALAFLGYAVRSLIECIACHRLISRRDYDVDPELIRASENRATLLFKRLQAFRSALRKRAASGPGL